MRYIYIVYMQFTIDNMGAQTRNLRCALSLLAVLLASCAAQAPLGYTCYTGHNCYRIYTERTNWGPAYQLCKAEGAHLGIINSYQEAFIYSAMFSATPNESELFLGIHDLFLEGTWMTIDGDSLESTGYSAWVNGEPNNADNEDCGAMAQGGLFNDVECDNYNMFICEIKPDTML